MKMHLFFLIFILIVVSLIFSCDQFNEETKTEIDFPAARDINYVSTHGQLQVSGSHLLNQDGNPVQLKGMSSFWINWDTGSKYANEEVVTRLVKDWGISVYRIAVGIDPGDDTGLISQWKQTTNMVDEVINACIANGIYIIVDWHAHNSLPYASQEKAFFKDIAQKYGATANVIYEIWNEPTSQNWSAEIKPYCQDIIDNGIRPYDSDNIIISGSSTWSQDVHLAAEYPLVGTNIMYSLHFYAGTHGEWLQERADAAMNDGIAIFVTEWGTSNADGGGGADRTVYIAESDQWINWMNENNLSWLNWSVCDKNEVSAALLPGASEDGKWPSSDLSKSGIYVKGKILE